MKKLLIGTALSLSIMAAQAQADERWPNWYAGLSGGVTFLGDSDISGSSTGELGYESIGGIGTFALGYVPPAAFQPFSNMRFEAELGYHYNGTDGATIGGAPVAAGDQLQAVSYMGNIYYDFRNNSRWTPYLGAGAGGATVSLSKRSGLGNTTSNDNVFAYQFMGGLSYAPVTMPMTEWGLGYRYFATQDPEFRTATGQIKVEDYRTHNVEVGGRFRF